MDEPSGIQFFYLYTMPNSSGIKKKILVCPLDWGLGHATRCIPVIRALTETGHEVIIGADDRPLQLLRKEFPSLQFISFPGYRIQYPTGNGMALKIALQAPGILLKIFREHRKLKKIIKEHQIDVVISDNRFGLWNKKIFSIYLTHQVTIRCPLLLKFLEPLLYRFHKHYINKYNACWIPDAAGEKNLSGDLSHHNPLPPRASFIGPLSRFAPGRDNPPSHQWDLMVILSGPEPQRSVLEHAILEQLQGTGFKTLVVKGTPEQNEKIRFGDQITIAPHLSSPEMEKAITSSKLIISRPGYSTIMDLSVSGKKTIFIPTPGQTEQEYLGDLLMRRGWCYCINQGNFNLSSALEQSQKYSGIPVFEQSPIQDLVSRTI